MASKFKVFQRDGQLLFSIDQQTFPVAVPDEAPNGVTRKHYLNWWQRQITVALERLAGITAPKGRKPIVLPIARIVPSRKQAPK
jgi:hypothetical protein